jgi:3'(2'), 5'-bisphosphate nucleotidase
MMSYEFEKTIAIQAVQAAAQLCERVRHEIIPEAMEKKDKSPVTIADFGSQALICRALAMAFPQDPVVGEEDAVELRTPERTEQLAQVSHYVQAIVANATAEQIAHWIDHGNGQVGSRYWTLDPIDGTKGFLRGDQYAIALALIEAGEIKVGVLGCPALSLQTGQTGLLGVAVRGQGATLAPLFNGNAQPMQVVSAGQAENLRFVESVESGHGDQSRQAAVAKAAGITQASLRMDSQAKYMAVAAGEAALYLRLPSPKTPDYCEKIWDHAAGVILVEEAGGRVTDIAGKPLDFSAGAKLVNNQGVVVSNGTLHASVLAALSSHP